MCRNATFCHLLYVSCYKKANISVLMVLFVTSQLGLGRGAVLRAKGFIMCCSFTNGLAKVYDFSIYSLAI